MMSYFPQRHLLWSVTALFSASIPGISSASAQTALPAVTVTEPRQSPKTVEPKTVDPKTVDLTRIAPPKRAIVRPVKNARRQLARPDRPQAASSSRDSVPPPTEAPGTSADVVQTQKSEAIARDTQARLQPKTGANTYAVDRAAVEALPQGSNTPLDRALLQVPGISQDSAASGDFHIRNEHANTQYRINGIMLPDGVSGFSQVLDTSFIRTLSLIDGALPAQYGLHTAGIIDIQTRDGADAPGGALSLYGGSHGTIIPSIEYAGVTGSTDYFFTGRFNTNTLGIENTTASHEATHDRTRQGRYFGYVSTLLEDASRLTFMSGATIAKYQIPNTPGQPPQFTAFGVGDFESSLLNENQIERSIFNVLAWQKTIGPLDTQMSYFQRYSTLHFVPDTIGDLVFNGVASDVTRTSHVNGLQSDNAYRQSDRNTIRFGFTAQVERAQAINSSAVLPTDADGNPIDAPFSILDAERKTGVVAGVYVSDEYRLTNQLTVNAGLRFDSIREYVEASQLSPRIGLTYKPFEDTTFHAGYARYFTPPELALSATSPAGIYDGTTLQPATPKADPVRPERSHYFDVGVTQRLTPNLEVGLDGYYKIAKNLLDDGQFGQALVLTAFNYDHATNEGVEFKVNYAKDGFRAYGNVAVAQQKASQITSNQTLFGPDELAYIATHRIYTDHDQLITASAGASYMFYKTRLSADFIYGSGLRAGDFNTGTVSPYATVNIGVTQDFELIPGAKPLSVRLSVVNLFDHAYEIRDGSGIGVFASQYGQRRGVFAGLSQRF